jgi:hypothetical protein
LSDWQELWFKFSTLLFSDTDPSLEYPANRPLIAHYTSLGTLEGIVKNEEIWLSNPLYMNDLEELKFGIELGHDAVILSEEIKSSLQTKERQDKFFQSFGEKYRRFAHEHALDMYVMCFSEHDKGNNGSGAAIVIDTGKLSVSAGFPIVLSKVKYGSRSERTEWVVAKIKSVATFISESEVETELLYILADALFERILLFAAYTKHNGFEEESEWRLAYIKSRDANKMLEPYFNY